MTTGGTPYVWGGESYEAMATGGHPLADGGAVYARLWNPTVARFEAALARLEQAGTAVAFQQNANTPDAAKATAA